MCLMPTLPHTLEIPVSPFSYLLLCYLYLQSQSFHLQKTPINPTKDNLFRQQNTSLLYQKEHISMNSPMSQTSLSAADMPEREDKQFLSLFQQMRKDLQKYWVLPSLPQHPSSPRALLWTQSPPCVVSSRDACPQYPCSSNSGSRGSGEHSPVLHCSTSAPVMP